MNFYQTLSHSTAAERNYLLAAPIISRCLRGEVSLADYRAFLTQAFHHVKHTVPLLMAVGARLSYQQEWLRNAIAEYIEEELGHQEWVLNDLAVSGGDKETARHGAPSFATELMVAYAYDTVQRGNPLGFFGMVFVLEGTSVAFADRAADTIAQALRLPPTAFSYLRSHGKVDIEHLQFFERLMNAIEDPADQRAIVHSAKRFYRLYGDVFRSLDTPPEAALRSA